MRSRSRSLHRLVVLALPLLAACTEGLLPSASLAPRPGPAGVLAAECRVDVAQRTIGCVAPARAAATTGARLDRIVGGQDVYVKLASTFVDYNAGGNELLAVDVTVQNLSELAIGTSDGSTASGVKIFFLQAPTTTGGTGTVTVANPDGVGTFTSTNQQYFDYPQILQPYEISAPQRWQFNLPTTVTSFSFSVYVSAAMVDEDAALLGPVWTGAVDATWSTIGNWRNDAPPAPSSTVAIPRASLLAPGANQPTLSVNTTVANFRVGEGSTLTLAGNTLTVTGNLDAPGGVTGGTVALTGSGARAGGNVAALIITGSASLQQSTRATGAVNISEGSLSVSDRTLTISIP